MSEEGPLSRWSRRKQAARDAPASDREEARPVAPASPQASDPAVSPGDTAETATTPELPAIDELTAESDYTPFLAADVPQELARAALRKLWRSDPVLANLDGLNDYDEDFKATDRLLQAGERAYQAMRDLEVEEGGPPTAQSENREDDSEAELPEPPAHGATREPERKTAEAEAAPEAKEASIRSGEADVKQS